MAGRKGAKETPKAAPKTGRRSKGNAQLKSFIERVERLRVEKKALAEDESAVFAEAKSSGFDPKAMRAILKERATPKHEREESEALQDVYRVALGMAEELPLFRAVGQMAVDPAARDQVLEALKLLVPEKGEIVLKIGADPTRIWRDLKTGEVKTEQYLEPPTPEPPAKPPTTKPGKAPPAEKPKLPPELDVKPHQARMLGMEAARAGKKVLDNPYPASDPRRGDWDQGWRDETGGDGMGTEGAAP